VPSNHQNIVLAFLAVIQHPGHARGQFDQHRPKAAPNEPHTVTSHAVAVAALVEQLRCRGLTRRCNGGGFLCRGGAAGDGRRGARSAD